MNTTTGTYKIFYARSPEALLGNTTPTVAELPQTHVFVRALRSTDLESVYWAMQGENWSPRGEARELIERLGLGHTSLSLGDVVQAPDGRYCRVPQIVRIERPKKVVLDTDNENGG